MLLLSLLIAFQIFTLPTVPEAITAPADRADYLAEHYWDHTPLSEILILEHPQEYEQFLVDYLTILPLIDEERQTKFLLPFLAYSSKMVRHYLCDDASPIKNQQLYTNTLYRLKQSTQSIIVRFLYQEDCDTCQKTMERLDNSSIIKEATSQNRLTIRADKTTETPHLWLTDTVGKTLMADITVEEIEFILKHSDC